MEIACLLKKQRTVEEGHRVVGLQFQHEVEILDAPVVVAHLRTKQSAIVVADEIVGLQVERRIIVCHCPTKVLLVVSGHSTVDEVPCMPGEQADAVGEIVLTLFPIPLTEADHGALRPDAAVVGVEFQTGIERLDGTQGVFLHQVDLSLHSVSPRIP